MTHTTESMVTQADREAAENYIKAGYTEWHIGIGDDYVRAERIALGLADDDELVQAFARHRTAAQPEREAVLDICPTCNGSGVGVADTLRVRCTGCGGVLITPAPAVSTEEIVAALEEATDAIDQLEWSVRYLTPENVRPDTSNARALVERARAILSRIRGEGE